MSRQDNIKKLLVNYNRRLQALQERQALYGLDTPIAILTEIEDIESQIEELQTELAGLNKEGDLPSRINVTTSGALEYTGSTKSENSNLTWFLWVGAVLLVVGAGVLIFWAGGVDSQGGFDPESVTTASVNTAATEQGKNQTVYSPTALTESIFTVDELEARLDAANIVFSTGTDDDRARVRSYITGPTSPYYLLAVNCLELVGSQRFKKTAYLDMIDKRYTLRVGEDNYATAEGQLQVEQLKTAVVEANNEYYGDKATTFEQLIEP